MKPEIWNKSQLESSGSKTCVEPIELELISIHNMQEAKTNRDGLELKFHGCCIRSSQHPLLLLWPLTLLTLSVPLWCWHHALLSSPGRAGTPRTGAHSPLQTQELFWGQDLGLGKCLGVPWQCWWVMPSGDRRSGEAFSVALTPSSSPPWG